mmetsp:Transcript_1877/g.1587  ORF Transcript_1877/g.1587 Transcript_1877/m.1587 type:complete len:450 (+) Transcript_1877:38-1387(+)
MAVSTEDDAAFARQLQAQEFGVGAQFGFSFGNTNNSSTTQSQDISAPLLDDANNQNQPPNDNNDNPNPLLNGNNDDGNNNNNNNNNDVNIGMEGAQGGNRQNGNAAQRARVNVIGHVRDADTDSPRILLLRITIALLEIIATSTVLAIGWNEGGSTSCGYLKWWVLIYTARHFITIPLRIHIRYRINRQPNDANNNNDGDQQNRNAVIAEKSIQILRWLSIMTFLLFLLGQTFLFTEKTCQSTAPTVWYYCLVIIILVYVSLALPFLIVLAICICLPCVLIIFRFFAEPEGADDRIIKDLPTRKVTADELRKKTETTDDGNELQNGNTENGDGDEDEDDDEDAPSCAICMQDYKVDDELRILPCKHEFHCECVDKWLPMKKICPLCRHDVTKKVQSPRNNNDNDNNNDSNSNNNNNNNDNYNPLASNANSVNNNPLTASSANGNNDSNV